MNQQLDLFGQPVAPSLPEAEQHAELSKPEAAMPVCVQAAEAAPEPQGEPLFLAGLNPQQQDAVMTEADRALQVLAGAGTGKTELISRRFVKLVKDLRHNGIASPEERILVVTFTKDAALNMRERIHQRLVANGESGLGPDAWISTFHQFCMRLLRLHPLEANLPPDFSILNSLEQQVVFNRVLTGVLSGDFGDATAVIQKYGLQHAAPANCLSLKSLETSGLHDVEALLEPGRVYNLINRIKTAGMTPAEFLEMAHCQSQRLTERLKTLPVPHDKDASKLDNMLVKVEAWTQALSPWAADGWNPLDQAEAKAERAGKKPTPATYKDEVKDLAEFYLTKKDYEPDWPDLEPLDAILTLEERVACIIAVIYALYQEELLRQHACDFDDLINHTIRLLERNPALKIRYRDSFEAIIVDEFQDSNGSQLRLLELLVRPKATNLTVVGDEKQSIYGFRFAQPENLDLIFAHGPCKKVSLQTNYRSLPPVLAVANQLTDQITRKPNQRLQPSDKNASAKEPPVVWLNLDGQVEKENGKLAPRPIDEQRALEARFIAVETSRLIDSGDAKFSDVAVLVKSHAKAEAIQQALADLNIPSVRQKNLGFFQDSVIKDAMASLRLMCDLGNDRALVRLLQRKLNQKQLLELMRMKNSLAHREGKGRVSLFDVCRSFAQDGESANTAFPAPVTEALADLAARLLALRKQKVSLTPAQLFQNLAKAIGFIEPRTPEWQRKQQRISLRTFDKLLYLFGQNKPIQPTLDEVLDILDQYAANPSQELPVQEELSGEDAVRIMTVFASKGLEFKVVFAAYTEQSSSRAGGDTAMIFDPQFGDKPGYGLMLGKPNGQENLKRKLHQRCWVAPRAEMEAQRVFYVALTRAEKQLYVIRGSRSAEWTAPEGYPSQWTRVLSETDDETVLQETYWDANTERICQRMTAIQEADIQQGTVKPV